MLGAVGGAGACAARTAALGVGARLGDVARTGACPCASPRACPTAEDAASTRPVGARRSRRRARGAPGRRQIGPVDAVPVGGGHLMFVIFVVL